MHGAAADGGRRLCGLRCTDRFGVVTALPGEHGPKVPHLHGHVWVLGHAGEGERAVEVAAGVVELPGVDHGPCGGCGEV